MSVKIMAEVWALDLPQSEKLVLLAFADHADDEGVCRPSVERVAWKTGFSERQVKRIGKQLRTSGLMVLLSSSDGGRGRAAVYQIRTQKGVRLSPFKSAKSDVVTPFTAQKGDNRSTERVTPAAQKGDIAMASQPSEPSREPSEKKESPLGSCEAGASLAPAWALEYLRFWNENRGLLPECRELPKGRVDKLRVRGGAPTRGSEEPSPFQAKFLEAVKRAAATPFLRGENDRGWRCTFDYLIANDTNILEILEGKFDGGGHGKSGSNRGSRNAVHSEGADSYGERPGRVVLNL